MKKKRGSQNVMQGERRKPEATRRWEKQLARRKQGAVKGKEGGANEGESEEAKRKKEVKLEREREKAGGKVWGHGK